MPEIGTILFDNDGILVDTEHLYFEATQRVLKQCGVSLTESEYVQLLLIESRGAWHLARQQGATDVDINRMREERDRVYDDLLRTEHIAIEGVADVLERLAGRFRMGIVTASDQSHFDTIHARTGFLPYFDFAVTSAHFEQSKPHPEPYRVAVRRAGATAQTCVAIEDSERGLRSALGAGLRCYVVPRGMSRAARFDGAERVAATLAEVADMLLA